MGDTCEDVCRVELIIYWLNLHAVWGSFLLIEYIVE
jgi:hypothetical protein